MTYALRLLTFPLVLLFVVVATGCGGGGGSSSTDDVSTTTDSYNDSFTSGSEGSVDDPTVVSVGTPHNGSVGAVPNSYYTFNVPEDGLYTITLLDPTVNVAWELYADSNYTDSVEYCNQHAGNVTESCAVTLNGGLAYYLEVSEYSSTGGTYTLIIDKVGSDGTTADPIALTIGESRDGAVDVGEYSYYMFTPNNSGVHVVSALTPLTNNVTVSVYSTPFTSTDPVLLRTCETICTINTLTAGHTYYIKISENSSSGSLYTISVTEGVSQGSIENPVDLVVGAVEPLAGAVDGNGSSYYTFTSGDAGEYILGTSVYGYYFSVSISTTPDYTSGVDYCSSTTECTLRLDSSTQYYVRVSNASLDAQYYQIAVNKGISEGSSSDPVRIYLDTPYYGGVSSFSNAYYIFKTSDFAGSYTISLSETQTNLSWSLNTVGGTSAFFTCNESSSDGVDEVCVTDGIQPNTDYIIKVSNSDLDVDSTFVLNVSEGGGSEGTYSNPVDLGSVSNTGLFYSGQVKGADRGATLSYYKFTTGSSAAAYQISLDNMSADLMWELQTDNGFTIQTCDNNSDTSAETCSTQDSSFNLTLDANTTYMLEVRNVEIDSLTTTFDLTLKPLIPADGCSAGAVECLDFEGSTVLPAGITQTTNANGNAWEWYVSTAESAGQPGTNHINTGTLDYIEQACFEYTPAVRPSVLDYSVKTINGGYTLSVGGSTVSGVLTGSEWVRVTHQVPAGTEPLTFEWCVRNSSSTSTPNIWFDDIEFR